MCEGPSGTTIKAIAARVAGTNHDVDELLSQTALQIRAAREDLTGRGVALSGEHKRLDLKFRTVIEKHQKAQEQAAERSRVERLKNRLLAKQREHEEANNQLRVLRDDRQAMLAGLAELRCQRHDLRQDVVRWINQQLAPTILVRLIQEDGHAGNGAMKKVNKGEQLEIPASTFNTMIDAAKAWKGARTSVAGKSAKYSPPDTDVILVQNDSGADRNRFDILGIDDVVISPTDNEEEFKHRVALSGVEPDPATHLGRFVVLLEPIADGKLGRACISGVCPCSMYVLLQNHRFADVNPFSGGRHILASRQFGGAEILWKESGTGTKWAVLRLGLPKLFRRFELKTSLAIGGTATAHPLDWNGADYVPDTAAEAAFTVYDSLGMFHGWARVAGVLAGSRGVAVFHHDRGVWEIVEMQHIARCINFTLTESMGYSTAGKAACYFNDYYDGQEPFAILGTSEVYDPQGIYANVLSGAKGKARWDDRSLQYHIIEIESMRGYAKVQAGFSNDTGDASRTVSVKKCNWDGTGVTGSAFNAKTELRANKDTALFTDYVVRYEVQLDGTKLIQSDIWDDPIGTRKLVGQADAIRDGWEEDTATQDMFIKGMGAGDSYGDTGGLDAHDHDPHGGAGSCIQVQTSGSSGVYALSYGAVDHSEESNNPEWIAYKWIKRTT